MEKSVGKVVLVILPNVSRPRWRWIVRKREDGRFIVRTPKIGTRIGDLSLLRDADFNKEALLPKGVKVFKVTGRTKKRRF